MMNNKKILAVAMALLLLSACGKKPAQTAPTETTPAATEETLPQVEYATAEANGIPVILDTLSRGDSVDVAGTFDGDHYVVKLDSGYGLVEKNLLRLEGKTPYAPWTGYAYWNAKVYDNYRLAGEPVTVLEANSPVEVLEELGWCCLVEYDGTAGYMRKETVAKHPVAVDRKDAPSGGNDQQDTTGEDGGEISLLSTLAPQEGAVSGKATVLADETLVILGYFDRGEKIPVVKQSEKDGYWTVCLDGLYAEVADVYICTAGEAAYPVWEGRTTEIVPLYDDFWMLGSPCGMLNGNTAVQVLCELENCYLVEAGDQTGYLAKEDVLGAETEAPKATEPAATQPRETEPAATTPGQSGSEDAETKPTEAPKPTEPAPTTAPTEPSKPTEPAKPTEATTPVTEPEVPTEETQAPTEPAMEWTPPIL